MQHNRLPTLENLYGNVPSIYVKEVDFNTTGIATGVTVFKILASAARPVLMSILSEVVTAFNAATTNVLTVGDSLDSGIDNYIAAGDVNEAAVGFATEKHVRLVADSIVKISYTQTGAAASTGKARFYFRLTPLWA